MLTCTDANLTAVLDEIAACMGVASSQEAVALLDAMLGEMELNGPVAECRDEEMARLVAGVNVERLSNHPVPLSAAALRHLYEQIVK